MVYVKNVVIPETVGGRGGGLNCFGTDEFLLLLLLKSILLTCIFKAAYIFYGLDWSISGSKDKSSKKQDFETGVPVVLSLNRVF